MYFRRRQHMVRESRSRRRIMKFIVITLGLLFLTGCPPEEGCETVMQCEDDVELLCDKNDSGCGEDCHYYVYESCYEVCK